MMERSSDTSTQLLRSSPIDLLQAPAFEDVLLDRSSHPRRHDAELRHRLMPIREAGNLARLNFFAEHASLDAFERPSLLDHAVDLGLWTWQGMGQEKLIDVDLFRFRNVLEEAGEAAGLLVLGEDQCANIRLLDVELSGLHLILESLQEYGQRHPIAQACLRIEGSLNLVQVLLCLLRKIL